MEDYLKKANLRATTMYLLYGRDIPEEEPLSYKERNERALDKFSKAIQAGGDLEAHANELAASISELFFEMGLRAGIRLAMDACTDRPDIPKHSPVDG